MSRMDIKDVPCLSCQRGYDKTHTCDVPDYCPCDRRELHDRAPGEPDQAPANSEPDRLARLLIETDALTPNHDGTPEHYIVDADNVEYLVKTVLELAANPDSAVQRVRAVLRPGVPMPYCERDGRIVRDLILKINAALDDARPGA